MAGGALRIVVLDRLMRDRDAEHLLEAERDGGRLVVFGEAPHHIGFLLVRQLAVHVASS
jgi:hypothetical protein